LMVVMSGAVRTKDTWSCAARHGDEHSSRARQAAMEDKLTDRPARKRARFRRGRRVTEGLFGHRLFPCPQYSCWGLWAVSSPMGRYVDMIGTQGPRARLADRPFLIPTGPLLPYVSAREYYVCHHRGGRDGFSVLWRINVVFLNMPMTKHASAPCAHKRYRIDAIGYRLAVDSVGVCAALRSGVVCGWCNDRCPVLVCHNLLAWDVVYSLWIGLCVLLVRRMA
jgi:hypothetical protein